jgi:hypothetical protein
VYFNILTKKDAVPAAWDQRLNRLRQEHVAAHSLRNLLLVRRPNLGARGTGSGSQRRGSIRPPNGSRQLFGNRHRRLLAVRQAQASRRSRAAEYPFCGRGPDSFIAQIHPHIRQKRRLSQVIQPAIPLSHPSRRLITPLPRRRTIRLQYNGTKIKTAPRAAARRRCLPHSSGPNRCCAAR